MIVKKHSVRLMAISKSYVALLAPKERGKGFQVDRSDGNQTNILELANVEKVEVHEKKVFISQFHFFPPLRTQFLKQKEVFSDSRERWFIS